MNLDWLYMSLEREPLTLCDDKSSTLAVTEGGVDIGVREGLAFRINDDEIVHPDKDCWFCVHLDYPGRKRANGCVDFDHIITNGEEFWRVRRSLGKSPMILTTRIKQFIIDTIQRHLGH